MALHTSAETSYFSARISCAFRASRMIGPLPKMCALCFLLSAPFEFVEAFENAFLHAFRHRGHRIVLVVERQVIKNLFALRRYMRRMPSAMITAIS